MAYGMIQLLPLAIVACMFALFIFSGLRNRSKQASEYGFSGSYTGRVGIGAGIASNWMSAASFLGLAGMFYLKGYFAMAYIVGWTGGYVLLLVLMATQIRRFGKFTAPDFVGFRYESAAARTLAALISIIITIIYCVAQFRGIALLVSWLFGIAYIPAVVVGTSLLVSFVVVSGALGVVRNQKLQYFVLIITFILPLMLLTRKLGYFWILPQFFTLMFGTAGLPHVLSRFYMVPGIRDARWGVVWGLFFIALIYWSAPAYGVLARLFEARNGLTLNSGGVDAADMIVLSAAGLGGVPLWAVGLLAAGGMSAAFSTTAGLLMTGSASFSFDLCLCRCRQHHISGLPARHLVAQGQCRRRHLRHVDRTDHQLCFSACRRPPAVYLAPVSHHIIRIYRCAAGHGRHDRHLAADRPSIGRHPALC